MGVAARDGRLQQRLRELQRQHDEQASEASHFCCAQRAGTSSDGQGRNSGRVDVGARRTWLRRRMWLRMRMMRTEEEEQEQELEQE